MVEKPSMLSMLLLGAPMPVSTCRQHTGGEQCCGCDELSTCWWPGRRTEGQTLHQLTSSLMASGPEHEPVRPLSAPDSPFGPLYVGSDQRSSNCSHKTASRAGARDTLAAK